MNSILFSLDALIFTYIYFLSTFLFDFFFTIEHSNQGFYGVKSSLLFVQRTDAYIVSYLYQFSFILGMVFYTLVIALHCNYYVYRCKKTFLNSTMSDLISHRLNLCVCLS